MTRRNPKDWMAPSRDGEEVTRAVLHHLGALAPGRRAFVWVHYFDPHLPYRPRPDFDAKYPRDGYAAQVAFVDAEIGRVLAALASDAQRSWRVVVAGDHGEGLGEKGEDTHGAGLYRATLHVPMIFHPRPDAPLRHPKPWGLVDLAPTIREWFGLPAADGIDGASLFREGRRSRPLFASSAEPSLLFGVEPPLGVRQGNLLYLKGGGEELYDLLADPAQTRDLSGSAQHAGALNRMRALCERTWPPGWPAEVLPSAVRPTEEEIQNLASLGYLSGAAPRGRALQRTPIREVMKDKSDWDRAREKAFMTGNNEALIALYARLLERYPDSLALSNWYGPLLARAGRYTEAVAVLNRAARLYPQDTSTLLNLGAIHLAMGKPERAEQLLVAALEREPGNWRIHKELGVLYADHLVNPEKAVAHLKKYLDGGQDADTPKWRNYIFLHEPHLKKAP